MRAHRSPGPNATPRSPSLSSEREHYHAHSLVTRHPPSDSSTDANPNPHTNQVGALLGDGLGDGAVIEPDSTCGTDFDISYLRDTSFALLQAEPYP